MGMFNWGYHTVFVSDEGGKRIYEMVLNKRAVEVITMANKIRPQGTPAFQDIDDARGFLLKETVAYDTVLMMCEDHPNILDYSQKLVKACIREIMERQGLDPRKMLKPMTRVAKWYLDMKRQQRDTDAKMVGNVSMDQIHFNQNDKRPAMGGPLWT